MTSDRRPAEQPSPAQTLAHGGSLYEFVRRWSLDPDDSKTRMWLIVATVSLAWLPLVILAVSRQLGDGEVDPLLLRAEPHARLLVALGLLLAAEPVFDGRAAMVAGSVATDGVLRPSSVAQWHVDIARLRRWRDAWPLNLCWLLVAYGALSLAHLDVLPDSPSRWLSSTSRGVDWSTATLAWWWYVLIGQPLLVLAMLRWFHRWVLWGVLAWRLARLDLNLRAIHADRAGGLGFTSILLDSLRLFILALGVALASVWFDEITAGRAETSTFAGDVVWFFGVCLAMMLLPYLAFTPKLIRVREAGIIDYSALMRAYASRFEQRWLARPEQGDEMLGHPDISGLADVRASGVSVAEMRSLIPSGKDLQAVLIVAALPFVAVALAKAPSSAQLIRGAVMRLIG